MEMVKTERLLEGEQRQEERREDKKGKVRDEQNSMGWDSNLFNRENEQQIQCK